MRDEKTAFGVSERVGSRAFVAAAALWACLPACGNVTAIDAGTAPPEQWSQVTCLVQRTECSGWVENDNNGLEGTHVNCKDGGLEQAENGPFPATACFSYSPDGGIDEQQAKAQEACNQYCESATGFSTGLYPLASVANDGGVVTCVAQAQLPEGAFQPTPGGQCATIASDAGATYFADCKLFGRECDGTKNDNEGNKYCLSMPPVTGGQIAGGCFDPSMITAEAFCQHNFDFPKPVSSNGSTQRSQFPYWNVAGVTPNTTTGQCNTEQAGLGFATFGIPAGPIGTFAAAGTTIPLTALGGGLTVGQACDSEGEFCSPVLGKMKVQLQDVTVAGLTFHNPQATLMAPVNTSFGTIPAGSMNLVIEGDIAIGHATTLLTATQPLTLSTTSTSASVTGSFSTEVGTSGVASETVTGTLAVTGSSTVTDCTNETPLQQLLGFETTEDWSSSQAALSLTPNHTQGCSGMQVGGGGYRTLNSVPFATPLPGTTQKLALDVFVPPNPPNPYWLGAVQMYLTCPSANFFNQYIGEDELTGLPLNKYSTLTYPIPAPIESVLQGSHPDCFFSIAVNANQTSTPPALDNLRFK